MTDEANAHGWLYPNGRYISCDGLPHNAVAPGILAEEGIPTAEGEPETILLKHGFLKIQKGVFAVTGGAVPTEAQQQTVDEMVVEGLVKDPKTAPTDDPSLARERATTTGFMGSRTLTESVRRMRMRGHEMPGNYGYGRGD